MSHPRRSLAACLVVLLLLAPPSTVQAGLWKSVSNFCSSLSSGAKKMMDGACDMLKTVASGVANGVLLPVNAVCGTDLSVSFTDPKTGRPTASKKVSPEFMAKLQSSHLIATTFTIAGKTFGDGSKFSFRVDQPGEVSCRIDWTGAPALAMILNGPGQVGYYDRVDGASPLYFKFTVTPELVKKGTLWTISVKDFSKSNIPSRVSIMAFTPRGMGETLAAATVTQRAGYAEQDIRKLGLRVADLENQLRLEKEFTRRLMDQIRQLRTRINAVDHKDDGKQKG